MLDNIVLEICGVKKHSANVWCVFKGTFESKVVKWFITNNLN